MCSVLTRSLTLSTNVILGRPEVHRRYAIHFPVEYPRVSPSGMNAQSLLLIVFVICEQCRLSLIFYEGSLAFGVSWPVLLAPPPHFPVSKFQCSVMKITQYCDCSDCIVTHVFWGCTICAVGIAEISLKNSDFC